MQLKTHKGDLLIHLWCCVEYSCCSILIRIKWSEVHVGIACCNFSVLYPGAPILHKLTVYSFGFDSFSKYKKERVILGHLKLSVHLFKNKLTCLIFVDIEHDVVCIDNLWLRFPRNPWVSSSATSQMNVRCQV
jgi:hypothetical protein